MVQPPGCWVAISVLPRLCVQRQRMRAVFRRGCQLEWMFWDGAYRCQQWPI